MTLYNLWSLQYKSFRIRNSQIIPERDEIQKAC